MNAKLAWLVEKYNYRSQNHIGGSTLQTHELCDVYLTEKELHQLHLDEEALIEILEEQAMNEKEREEKIRQKQAEDEEFMLEFGRKFDSDYDTRVEPSFSTSNPVRIIPVLGKVVEDVDEDDDFKSGVWVSVTNYVTATGGTVIGCLEDIKNFLKKKKLDEVIAIVKSCLPNDIGAAMILANVSIFTLKPSKHYHNITMRNVVKVFRKDTVPRSDND
nr:hypothetical protein [Tanacetum cinerariifolium]